MAAAAEAEGLSALLRAKSKDDVARFFNACFRHRHDGLSAAAAASSVRLASAPAVAELFGAAEAGGAAAATAARHALCCAGVALVRRALYDSAEARGADQLASLLPAGLDARLASLVASVLATALPAWREAAVEQRIGLPRLQRMAWQVEVLSASSEQQQANEPVLTLSLTVSDGGSGGGGGDGLEGGDGSARLDAMPAARSFAVTANAASLAALVGSMRRIKEALAAL